MTQRTSVGELDATGGSDGQVPVISGGKFSIGAPAGDPEFVRDTIAAALVAGTNVTISIDDAANTITISAAAGGGGSTIARVRTQGAKTTDYSIAASGSFADLDNTYFSTSIPAVVGDEIEVEFHGQAYANTAGGTALFAVAVNGVIPTPWANGHELVKCDAGGQLYPMHLNFSFTVASGDLVTGAVPIKIRWRGNASTVGLHSATTGTSASVPQLTVINWG